MSNTKKNNTLWSSIGSLLFVVSIAISIYLGRIQSNLVQIHDFVYKKDADEIVDLFRKNYYWLTANPKTSPETFVRTRAVTEDPSTTEKLTVKVLRENDKFAGFIAYYKKSFYLGYVLYLGVYEEFRGRGYGERLIRFAIEDLKKMNAKKIKLITRVKNNAARSLYKKVGFKQTAIDDIKNIAEDNMHVYFEIDVN